MCIYPTQVNIIKSKLVYLLHFTLNLHINKCNIYLLNIGNLF